MLIIYGGIITNFSMHPTEMKCIRVCVASRLGTKRCVAYTKQGTLLQKETNALPRLYFCSQIQKSRRHKLYVSSRDLRTRLHYHFRFS